MSKETNKKTAGKHGSEKKPPDLRFRRKRAVGIAAVCACVISAAALLVMLLTPGGDDGKQNNGGGNTGYKAGVELSFPDWDEDINDDERWLEKNRYMTYARDGAAITVTDGAYSDFGDTVVFLADYFESLTSGDAERLNGFYADSYFETHEPYERITMQRIYDLRVEHISMTEDGSTLKYIYKITYKILANDGTFRSDVLSDAERAQYYTLVDDGYDIKITDVSYEP